MNEQLINDVQNMCVNIFNIIKKNNPMIRTIIIKYNEKTNTTEIGRNLAGSFYKCYYPVQFGNDHYMEEIKNNLGNVIEECFMHVKEKYPRVSSYIIYYNDRKRKANICLNKLGQKSIARSRVFDEIDC